MSALVIGIHAPMRCGKSTVVSMIEKLIAPTKIYRLAFADSLREEVIELYGIDRAIMYNKDATIKESPLSLCNITNEGIELFHKYNIVHKLIDPKTLFLSPRQLLQIHGTEIRRNNFGSNYWTNKGIERINEIVLEDKHALIMIDDLRFEDEASAIIRYNGLLYKIHPYPGYEGNKVIHSSEVALSKWKEWDREFTPKFGLEHLEDIAKSIIADIRLI